MICKKCGTNYPDNLSVCPNCGAYSDTNRQSPPPPPHNDYNQYQSGNVPPADYEVDSYDHTADFSPKDISDNKVVAMLPYLLGATGIIIASLVGGRSPYVGFHIHQALKFTVTDVLLLLCATVLCWTVIVPIAAVIMLIVLLVIRLICFFQVCLGEAKEPVIIRNLGFLK